MTIKGGRRRRTKKHHRRKTRHHKRRRKRRRTRHRMRGGALPGIAITSPLQPFNGRWGGKMAAFPPGPIVRPGVVDLDAKFYGKLDQPLLPDPTNTHGSGVTRSHGKIKGGRKRKRGGRKSRKGGRKTRKGGRKSRKGGNPCGSGGHGLSCIKCCQRTGGGPCWATDGKSCTKSCCKHYGHYGGGKKTRKGGRGRGKRGGSMSSFLSNNVPGFSDVRDVYWKGGEILKDGYNTWFGYNAPVNTSAGVQPIGKDADVVRPEIVDIPRKLKSGSLQAKKYNVA